MSADIRKTDGTNKMEAAGSSKDSTFGKRLGKELKKQGYTMARFAMEIGVGESVIADYVHDRRCPKMENLIKICEKLDVSADWFIWGDEQVG